MALEIFMKKAIEEAEVSLREGNNGFGAVITKGGQVISSAHDDSKIDINSHAEIKVLNEVSQKLGNLSGCILVTTHEPCPLCAAEIIRSGITEIAYGFSSQDTLTLNEKQMNISTEEVIEREGVNILVHKNILNNECSVLYRKDVRAEIEKLRNVNDKLLEDLNADSINRRLTWYYKYQEGFCFLTGDLLSSAHKLLIKRFNATENELPIISQSDNAIVFHSQNFCPTLEACKILGLDTRSICKKLNENATDILIKQIDPRLKFSRNYEKLRPYTEYCEEMISIEDK